MSILKNNAHAHYKHTHKKLTLISDLFYIGKKFRIYYAQKAIYT